MNPDKKFSFQQLTDDHQSIIISGPCSAETEEQVMETAKSLAISGKVHLFRSGIWKPRTKPGLFEGVGEVGLAWLNNVQSTYGLPVTTEVANAGHVELALKYNIDVLWLGARTTVSPFAVQEIASALKGVNIPVLIKNPLNPDIQLWIGAVERIQHASIGEIGLIHRGFSSFSSRPYRNAPMWQIPIEMKSIFPNLPMICDPSHICGNRHLLKDIAQKSIDLDFSGLMLESHPNPDQAWSDAAQQLTPNDFLTLLHQLVWRSNLLIEEEQIRQLHLIRAEIDHTDDELIRLLSLRMKLSDKIGALKKNYNVTILQAERWNEILQRFLQKGKELGLSDEFVKKYFEAVHLESINHQNNIMNEVISK